LNSPYTAEAVAYANQVGVALFLMDPYGTCESASDFARLLAEPTLIEERKRRLEDLRVARYIFAVAATETDLDLFTEFKRNSEMEQEEGALFAHVLSSLQTAVRDFRSAVESKQFEQADIAFGEIQRRTAFLSWVTGPNLKNEYTTIADAVAEGWRIDATPGSEYVLQRVGDGVRDLRNFLVASLDGWKELFPDGIRLEDLIDDATVRAAGMLRVVATDQSLLSPDLLLQLKGSIRSGLAWIHRCFWVRVGPCPLSKPVVVGAAVRRASLPVVFH
jgi:hypothetical protein